MSIELPTTVVITPDGEEVNSFDVHEGRQHCLRVETIAGNRDVIFNFSTRRAMYDFAVSLLQEAVYGKSGQQEFYPLAADGNCLTVNGVRMSEDSFRLFVFYENASNVSTA